ncbi:MAG TPA: mandelate racemase [Oceanospirillaceae bacterium]|nr:mandelate racemase [Oceanospirillaceae bacterium]
MKITAINTHLIEIPFAKPIQTAIHDMHSVGCVCLDIETDDGLVGEAYAFTLNAVRLKAFDEMLNGFKHQLIGQDPHYVTGIWQAIWQEINPTGHKGVTISALSTIDTALWDLVGKAAEQPLHKLFGACRDQTWTYASGGLWLSQSIDELLMQADEFVQQGFRAMKVRVGNPNIDIDIERVRELRQALGNDIEILADANQAYTPKQAIRLGKALEQLNIVWLEEPVAAYDLKGHAKVTAALHMDIASGETEYTSLGMQSMIDAQACDILMPDLQRIGGLTEMRRVAALANAHNMRISSHIFTEQSLCIAGSTPNCMSVEHMPWYAPMFKESMVITDGYIAMPQGHGTGFTFCPEARQLYALV